ncbi:MAG: tRNA-dihydrouridine synthase [Deltaproteobacteria bacterium]|nr:tRNA-dihydrouridine synthase [Deltaproteobacteria bacterium]MBW2306950.1 tRNA-dihydrouridine synthase [Deltaproteobacteria bacterium]
MDLKMTVAGVTFKNPLLAASANHVRGIENTQRVVRSGVGGVVCKSVTELEGLRKSENARFAILDEYHRPCQGKIPRMYTFYSRTGSMEHPDDWLRDLPLKLKLAQEHNVVFIGSIAAGKPESWIAIARMMADNGVPMIELNLGCPHYEKVAEGMGALLGQNPEACSRVITAVRSVVKIPVIVKLTPQVADLMTIVKMVQEAGADAITVSNRFLGFAVDIENGRPYTGSMAGVGGPWIKPLTQRWVAQCYLGSPLPILGSNGAADWSDVIEFMMAGASLIQMAGAFMLEGPRLIPKILEGIEAFMKRKGYGSVNEIIGMAARAAIPYTELHRLPVQRMRLDRGVCTRCGNCLGACYYGALHQKGDEVIVGESCVGCELCLAFCPTPGALTPEAID